MPVVDIGVGNAPNDGNGDPLRTAGQKINQNFGFINQKVNDLRFNNYQGDFDATNNRPNLQDSTGIKNQEYRVANAGFTGANKDFGAENVLFLKNEDIIIFNGTSWIVKVNNNQTQESLPLIPPSNNSPIRSGVLNDRMRRIFDHSGYRITNAAVGGVSNSSNIETATFYFYAVSTERYLLVDLNNLDSVSKSLFSVRNKIYNIATATTANLSKNDIIGEIDNQATFISNPIDGLSGVPSNYTIFEISQTFIFSTYIGLMSVSINLVGDLNGLITQTIVFEDRDFVANELIDLFPAPGSGKIILPTSFCTSINLTKGYQATEIFNLLLGDAYLGQILLPTTSTNPFFYQKTLNELYGGDGSDSNTNTIINKPLQVQPLVSMSGGIGLIKLHITYRIIEL